MYAVIRTGGKQYRVAENQRLTVERLPGDPGETLKLGDVLMIAEDGSAPVVGTPSLDKAAVFAEVLAQTRGDKVVVFKKKRRKNYRRTKGHRQDLTVLRIAGISASGKAPAATKKAAKAETPAEEPTPETAAETPAPEAQDAAPAEAPAAEAPVAEPKKAKKAAEPKSKADAEEAPKATPDTESKE